MELRQLRCFSVLARKTHITQAAEELAVTQPVIARAIRRLEEEIGVPLFDRKDHTLRLNQFGRTFLGYADAVLLNLENGKRKVRDMASLEEGEISLITTSLPWLPNLLHRFQTLYPAARLRLSQYPLAELLQLIDSNVYDFCLLPAPLARPGITWRFLRTDEIFLVVPNTHRFAAEPSICLRDVVSEAVVIEKAGTGLRDLVDSFCQQAGITLAISCEIEEPASLYEFVKAGLGVGFTPELLKNRAREQGLTCVHLTDPACKYTLGFAWQEKHFLSRSALAFHEFVIAYFNNLERDPSWYGTA